MVKVEQDPEDETERECNADPFSGELPEPDDPISGVFSLERDCVGRERNVGFIDETGEVSGAPSSTAYVANAPMVRRKRDACG